MNRSSPFLANWRLANCRLANWSWLTTAWMALILGCNASKSDLANRTLGSSPIQRTSEKGPVKLEVSVSPEKPRLSDIVHMDIVVTAAEGVKIQVPHFGQAVGDFLIRDYSELPQPKSGNQRRFRYQLEPVHTGKHLIRSVMIEFMDARQQSENEGKMLAIESEPIEVEVTSELGDQLPSLANLEPMLPPRPVDSHFSLIWLWALVPMLLALSIGVWLVRRKKPSRSLITVKTPGEIAQEALAALLARDLPAKGLFQEFYLGLTGIVRTYIEGTTGVRAPEQTTEEFLRAMRSRSLFAVDQAVKLQDFLEAADMVKYAGQQPTEAQIQHSIARAREFVLLKSEMPIADGSANCIVTASEVP